MKLIGAGLDRGIENRRPRTSELGTEVGSLNLEFLNCINWRKDNVVRAVEEVYCVRVVIDSIQHVVVLRRTKPIGRKRTVCGIPTGVGLGCIYTRNQLRQESKISTVERQIIHITFVDYLTYRSILGLQHGSRGGHFHSFGRAAGRECEIYDYSCTDIDFYIGLAYGLKTLKRSLEFIHPDSDR